MLADAFSYYLRARWRIAAAAFGGASLLNFVGGAKVMAAPMPPQEDIPALVSNWLIFAIVSGVVLASAGAAYLFMRATAKAKLTESRAGEAIATLRQELEVAQAIVMAEPQALIAFETGGEPRLVNHLLDSKLGVPVRLRNLLRFASWLDRSSALALESRLKELKSVGHPFELTLKTLAGPNIEAEGRASVSGYYLKFRDLAGRNVEVANLLRQQRTLNEELASQKALLDSLPTPIWFRDAEGRLVWVNRAYIAAVDGARMDDVIEHQRELLETRQRRAADNALAAGETFRKRLQTVIAGERHSFDTIIVPVGRASAGTVIDVAPLENVQDALSRQTAAHSRTLDRVASATAIYTADQRLSFYNRAFAKLWQLDPIWLNTKPSLGEVLDQLRQKQLLPEQADYRKWRAEQLKAFEYAEGEEDWWHLPDGRTIHVIIDCRPDGGLTYLLDDVTERLALESRYNALISVQRETLENLREGVAMFGTDGRLKLFNASFVNIWKLDRTFLDGGPHIDDVRSACQPLLDDDDLWAAAHRAVTGVFETREAFDGTVTRPDGISLAYAGVPLPDGGTVLTYIDISDTKRVELALIERNEALEAADRLKNTFLSHVSYELRTPLTNIIGFSEMLAQEPIGPLVGKQCEYLDDIRTSSTKLLAIINDIIDLATIDAGALELKLAPVPVREITTAAEKGVRDRLTKAHINLDVQVAPDIDIVMADQQRITQILFHLLSNAIGFSSEGDTITLSCRKENDITAFTVQDSGVGIPEEFQASVFGRFESHSQGSKHRGAGLGLAIVKSLVELHGGQIKLQSAPGVGTTVTVLIPQLPVRRTGTSPVASASQGSEALPASEAKQSKVA